MVLIVGAELQATADTNYNTVSSTEYPRRWLFGLTAFDSFTPQDHDDG